MELTYGLGSVESETYTRDPAGNLKGRDHYHYDEAGHLLAETDASGAALRIHFWADDSPVAQQVGGTLTYLHVDHLDTPRWGTDTSGALMWRWRSESH